MKPLTKCQIRAYCRKHGFTMSEGQRPPLNTNTIVRVIFRIDVQNDAISKWEDVGPIYDWRWFHYTDTPDSDYNIVGYKVLKS